MDHIDLKYINLVGIKLQKFKKVKNNLFNFRCPICGDSQKNKTKARGYLYQVKCNTNYKCHNCGLNISFNNFLKKIDSNLYKEYSFDKFKSGKTGKNFVHEEPKFNFKEPVFTPKLDLPKASINSEAQDYLLERKIDPEKFFYAKQFKRWVNTRIKKFSDNDLQYDEPRIVIPLYFQNNLVGFQGRSIKYSPIKYITIMLDEFSPKIYGYDTINVLDEVYVLEGPFDSTFIKNSIAMCGADVDLSNLNISHPVYVYDNEPRNNEIHMRMLKKIEDGNSIVIWPSSIKEKDVNEMVLSGLDIQSVIKLNTYSGLEAKLKFTTWKKI